MTEDESQKLSPLSGTVDEFYPPCCLSRRCCFKKITLNFRFSTAIKKRIFSVNLGVKILRES